MKKLRKITNKLKKLNFQIDNKRFDNLVDRILKFVTQEIMDDSYFLNNKYGFPPFLVHSDLWSSNILWKINSNGDITNDIEAIIDWQMAAPGNPGLDIARALAMNTTSKYRRENTDRILKYYLDCLSHHLNGTLPLTIEQVCC